jgi:hypothetical protein
MTDKEQAAIRRAIGAIEAAKNDAMGRFYVQGLMSHETALAELRHLLSIELPNTVTVDGEVLSR